MNGRRRSWSSEISARPRTWTGTGRSRSVNGRPRATPPYALIGDISEGRESVPFQTGGPRANKGLDLTNPDAAQSVAHAPLCLLSGLAAQAHVGLAGRTAPTVRPGLTLIRPVSRPIRRRLRRCVARATFVHARFEGSRCRHRHVDRIQRVYPALGGVSPAESGRKNAQELDARRAVGSTLPIDQDTGHIVARPKFDACIRRSRVSHPRHAQ